jgi:hypothetical protein
VLRAITTGLDLHVFRIIAVLILSVFFLQLFLLKFKRQTVYLLFRQARARKKQHFCRSEKRLPHSCPVLVGPAGFEPTTFPRKQCFGHSSYGFLLTAPELLHPSVLVRKPVFAAFWSPSSYLPRLRPHQCGGIRIDCEHKNICVIPFEAEAKS